MSARLAKRFQGGDSTSESGVVAARKLLLAAIAVSIVLWFTPYAYLALYPVRLFVTFVHESGHAITALISGGDVRSLHVDLHNASGVTYIDVSPWWAWLSLSGGYLGSTIFGATLIHVGRFGKRGDAGKIALAGIAVFVLAATLLWAHNFVADPGTFALGLGLALLFGLAARFASPAVARFLVSFLAVQCVLNAFVDLGNLMFLTAYTSTDNDAKFMSQQYPFAPPLFWATLWSLIAIVVLVVSLRSLFRKGRGAQTLPLMAP